MSIVKETNKQMLFDLLKSIGTESNLVIDENKLFKFITEKCNYFHTNRYEFDYGSNLNEVNKRIVNDGYNFIMSNQNRQQVQPNKKVQQGELSRREMFDVGLANKEAQFKKMINPQKPKDIDFSDNKEDLPIKNLDVIMNQTLADRQRELTSITQKYNHVDKQKAQAWLNREDDTTPKIKIEKNSNINLNSPIEIKSKKRVTFNVNEEKNNNLTNFFSKLKQKPTINNSDIMDKLNTIISNQNEILILLKKS